MTYAELIAAVQSYLQNYEDDFVAALPTFVQQAEQRVYNSVQFPALRRAMTGTATTSVPYLSCPDDFLAPHSLAVVVSGVYTFLVNKDVSFIREAYPAPTSTGVPKYYAIFGPQSADPNALTFILGPTPASNYSFELQYYFYPESIVTATNTWLGDNFDTVLLYGTLVEAYIFLKGEQDLIDLYNGKYKEALAQAKRLGDGLERRDSYRNGQLRAPVE